LIQNSNTALEECAEHSPELFEVDDTIFVLVVLFQQLEPQILGILIENGAHNSLQLLLSDESVFVDIEELKCLLKPFVVGHILQIDTGSDKLLVVDGAILIEVDRL